MGLYGGKYRNIDLVSRYESRSRPAQTSSGTYGCVYYDDPAVTKDIVHLARMADNPYGFYATLLTAPISIRTLKTDLARRSLLHNS